jgi:hypothetical protein
MITNIITNEKINKYRISNIYIIFYTLKKIVLLIIDKIISIIILLFMTDLNFAYATYYNPANTKLPKHTTGFDFGKVLYSELPHELSQEHSKYAGKDYQVGLKGVFSRNDYSDEPVGELFFSEENIKRIQKLIKNEIAIRSKNKLIMDEDQDAADLIIAMRGVYQMYGNFRKEKVVHQVKVLNKKLVDFIVPDMLTEIKQYYGYLKDINEPLKPIDRPMNVSNAGRRTLPSITTMWSR